MNIHRVEKWAEKKARLSILSLLVSMFFGVLFSTYLTDAHVFPMFILGACTLLTMYLFIRYAHQNYRLQHIVSKKRAVGLANLRFGR